MAALAALPANVLAQKATPERCTQAAQPGRVQCHQPSRLWRMQVTLLAQEWMQPLQPLGERLTRLSVSIATPGAPGWECLGIHRALAQARSDLGKLKR